MSEVKYFDEMEKIEIGKAIDELLKRGMRITNYVCAKCGFPLVYKEGRKYKYYRNVKRHSAMWCDYCKKWRNHNPNQSRHKDLVRD